MNSRLHQLPPTDLRFCRALHYGDGVFRTLLKVGGELIDLRGQIARLRADAAVLGLTPPAAARLVDAARQATRGRSQSVVKLLLWRAGQARGYRPRSRRCESLALAYPLPNYGAACWSRGIDAFVSSLRLSAQPALAGIKHLNRLEQVLASRDWPAGAHEGILCDAGGAPVCGSRSNLFWVRRGVLFTPTLADCGVAGRVRERVLALADRLGYPVRVERRPLSELFEAEEAFVTNSLIGIWPLRRLVDRRWPGPGEMSLRLAAALAHPRWW